MTDTPQETGGEETSVLRPFVERPNEPLPPVESPTLPSVGPPATQPADTAPAMPADLTPSDVIDAPGEVPIEGVVPDIEPPAASSHKGIVADPQIISADPEVALAAALSDDDRPAQTITLRRKPFLVGLGVVGAVLFGLLALWLNADDGDRTVDTAVGPPEVDTVEPVEPVDATPDPTQADASAAAAAAAQGTIDDLTEEVAILEAELADQPVAALPGTAMQRVVIAADAKFVSANDVSVAVVGPFGGLALIDSATNTVVSTGQVADRATRILRTDSTVWITNYTGSEILRVDPVTMTVTGRIGFPGPDGLAKDGGTLVVASYDEGYLARIDPASGEILQQVDVGGNPTAVLIRPEIGIWAAIYDTGELVQIDPESFEIVRRVTVGDGPVGLGLTDTGLWAANHEEGTVVRVNPRTGVIEATVIVGDGPTELLGASGSLWVTVTDAHDLVQIDTQTAEIVTRTPLGGAGLNGGPTGISRNGDTLWIAILGERSVARIDLAGIG